MDTIDKYDVAFASGAGIAIDFAASWYSDKLYKEAFASSMAKKGSDAAQLINKYAAPHQAKYARSAHPIKALQRFVGMGGDDVAESAITHGKEIAYRKAALNKGVVNSLAATDQAKIGQAKRFGTLSKAISSVWIVAAAGSVTQSAVKSFREKGANEMSKRHGFDQEHFEDSQTAYTTRQRAMQAIAMSGGGHRRALGNEASFIHSSY